MQRSFEPPQVKHERLMVVSVAGFVVNLVGIFVFQHGGSGECPATSVLFMSVLLCVLFMSVLLRVSCCNHMHIQDMDILMADMATPTGTMTTPTPMALARLRSCKVLRHVHVHVDVGDMYSTCRNLPPHPGRHAGKCWCDHFLHTHPELWVDDGRPCVFHVHSNAHHGQVRRVCMCVSGICMCVSNLQVMFLH